MYNLNKYIKMEEQLKKILEILISQKNILVEKLQKNELKN